MHAWKELLRNVENPLESIFVGRAYTSGPMKLFHALKSHVLAHGHESDKPGEEAQQKLVAVSFRRWRST